MKFKKIQICNLGDLHFIRRVKFNSKRTHWNGGQIRDPEDSEEGNGGRPPVIPLLPHVAFIT